MRLLLHRSIEFRQLDIVKYLLTELQMNQNYNLLHIACKLKSKTNDNRKKDRSDLDIIKTILKYDKFANLNVQDTYGNTPVHLAAQNGKAEVLQYFLETYNPQIYIKNSEGLSALHSSSNQDIFKVCHSFI